MKKTAKIVVSLLLLLSVVFSLASCEAVAYVFSRFDRNKPRGYSDWYEGCPVPEGYTAGLTNNYQIHSTYEYKWLETYEEMVDAVTRLRAHGNEIEPIALFDCEEYGYDLKFCVQFTRYKSEKLSEGQHYFDRKLTAVIVSTYVFFEDVTIDELIYGWVDSYNHIRIDNCRNVSSLSEPTSTDVITIEEFVGYDNVYPYYAVSYNGVHKFVLIGSYFFELTEELNDIFKNTIVIIK